MTASRKTYPESRVLDGDIRELLIQLEIEQIDTRLLIAPEIDPQSLRRGETLPYNSSQVFEYARNWCGGGNDCPDGSFPLDCTHFMCHCLNACGVAVSNPSAACQRGLCIRVNDLAEAFYNSVGVFDNVKRVSTHSSTRKGDFCFIPSWFGLSKEHVMLLADTASPRGAKVYAHSNNRCGSFVEFEGADCIYYRIEDAHG